MKKLLTILLAICQFNLMPIAHTATIDQELEQFLQEDFNDTTEPTREWTIDDVLRLQEEIESARAKEANEEDKKEWFIPLELSKGDLIKAAVVGTTAIMVFQNDRQVMDFVQENRNHVTEVVSQFGEFFGSEMGIYGAAGGLILGVVIKNDKIKRVSLLATKAMLVTGLITRALKMSFSRTRPNATDNPYEFDGFNWNNSNVSFPSGHTTQAFAVATVIAEEFKQYKAVPILAYSAAAIAGWSRVHGEGAGSPAHWASDVIIGGLIGHIFAKQAIYSKMKDKGILLSPTLSPDGNLMFNISYSKRPKKKMDDEICEEGQTPLKDLCQKPLEF